MKYPLFFCLVAGATHAQAREDANQRPFQEYDAGEVVFVSSTGELDSDSSLAYVEQEKTLKVDRLDVKEVVGGSINFRGREIRNAHIVDSSIEGLKHLSVESLSLHFHGPSTTDRKSGLGLALIDANGVVSSSNQLRWDDAARELRVPTLSSFSKDLGIQSDVDLNGHQLKNVNIEANTSLKELIFRDGIIENSVLSNVTATGLSLGDVTLDSLVVSDFDSAATAGSFLVAVEGGKIEPSSMMKRDKGGRLSIDSEVVATKSMDLNGQDLLNANIISGSINGNIDVSVDSVKARGISLTDVRDDKTTTSDGLAVLSLDGELRMGPVTVDSNTGGLGDIKMHGSIEFLPASASRGGGDVKGAHIVGGTVDRIERLGVSGETELGSGLQVTGETYLDGSLTVSGSVLGSGPYVDISDGRFKTNIERLDRSLALEKLLQLEGVSYELDLSSLHERHHRLREGRRTLERHNSDRQLGFIAQDVENLFPEIVSNDEQGFKGVQYSRFAPIFVESMKQLAEEMRVLRQQNSDMMIAIASLEQRLMRLENNV